MGSEELFLTCRFIGTLVINESTWNFLGRRVQAVSEVVQTWRRSESWWLYWKTVKFCGISSIQEGSIYFQQI
jgi:hypothetical protein